MLDSIAYEGVVDEVDVGFGTLSLTQVGVADDGERTGSLCRPTLPDGSAAESSVNRVLAARGTVRSAPAYADDVETVRRQIGVRPDTTPEESGRSGAPTSTEEDAR